MNSKIDFALNFKNRMFTLALLIGFLITVTMPVTFFVLSWTHEADETVARSKELASRLQETIKGNPNLWKFNVQKFTKVFAEYNNQDTSTIKIFDNDLSLIFQEDLDTPSIFDLKIKSQIIYNNRTFGYVEISRQIHKLIYESLLLLAFFLLLGTLIGIILYKYPTKNVSDAQKKVENAFKKLNILSYYDSLTGLPNRMKFNELLTETVETAKQNKKMAAVMFLDLDRFKLINDTMGHSIGDKVLQAVAQRLNSCMRKSDFIARQGGDEFTVLVSDIADLNEVAKIAEKLITTLAEPFLINNQEFFVTTSIGISIYPTNSKNVDSLIKYADIAMYNAKEQGKNKFKFYTSELDISSHNKLKLETDLQNALKNKEFVLHYQPIIDIVTKKIVGLEALIRWQHTELGLIPPMKFIPLAEETGLIVPIGFWVLKTACAQNKLWQEEGLSPVYVSVNMSLRQFKHPNLIQNVIEVLAETRLNAKYIRLEITESISMFDEEKTIITLSELNKLGIQIAIDDFGTEYSSLNCLKKFPIWALKIDKSFIENILSNPSDAAIISFIVQMAHSLKLNVIAEGVETEEQLTFLQEHFCDQIQGYIYSKALPASEIKTLFQEIPKFLFLAHNN